MTPNAIALTYREKSPTAHKLACEWKKEADIKRAYFDKVEQNMKKRVDSKKHHLKYKAIMWWSSSYSNSQDFVKSL